MQEGPGRGLGRRRAAIELLRKSRHGAGRQALRAGGERGPRGRLHPSRQPGGRAHRGELRDRLRRAHATSSPTSCATWRCRSPPPAPSTCAARRCRPIASRRSARSSPPRPRPGKPAAIIDRIVDGEGQASSSPRCVSSSRRYIRDDKTTVQEMIQQASAKTGENIVAPPFRALPAQARTKPLAGRATSASVLKLERRAARRRRRARHRRGRDVGSRRRDPARSTIWASRSGSSPAAETSSAVWRPARAAWTASARTTWACSRP